MIPPNLVGDPELPQSQRTVARWFNTEAFTVPSPAPQAFGTAGVGVMRGPGLANFDFSLVKNISFKETKSVQFRAEAFNFPNLTNLGQPDNYFYEGSPTFGTISAAKDGRQIQFGLKFIF